MMLAAGRSTGLPRPDSAEQGERTMDLRVFYQKIRSVEKGISTPHAVVVSLETSDGGKPGLKTEVSRESAATLIVEGRARLASQEEADEFHKGLRDAIKDREREQAKGRMNFNLISDEELASLRNPGPKQDQ
jgi:hypothetical protein